MAIQNDACQGICLYWWPKLPLIKGWNQDKSYSIHYAFNAQVRIGESFKDAVSVIYAKALYKPNNPHLININALIQQDREKA